MTEIARRYRPGDRIYLIGFSRGAYTARCVAGVIRRCGLLTRREYPLLGRRRAAVPHAAGDATKNVPIHPELVHKQLPPMEFLGLFDTVGSLGVPMWGWWFNWRLFFRNTSVVDRSHRRSVSMSIMRWRWTSGGRSSSRRRSTRRSQRGAGPDHSEGSLVPRRALRRRRRLCRSRDWPTSPWSGCWGLHCAWPGLPAASCSPIVQPDPLARMHDELQRQPAWRLLGSWPRWHPASMPTSSERDGARQGRSGPGTARYDGRSAYQPGVLRSGRTARMGPDRPHPRGRGRALSPDLAVGRMARRGVARPAIRRDSRAPSSFAGSSAFRRRLPQPELHDAWDLPRPSPALAAARRRADASSALCVLSRSLGDARAGGPGRPRFLDSDDSVVIQNDGPAGILYASPTTPG